MIEFITAASDSRNDDLQRLLKSIRRFFPKTRIKIIPFSDDIETVRETAQRFSCDLQECDPEWDVIGKKFYGTREYRPGSPSYRYFRKLNMFSGEFRYRIFLDANSILLSRDIETMTQSGVDLLFHSSAMKGRNFSAAFNFSEVLQPGIRNGFNLGFCAFSKSAADKIATYARLAPPQHANLLGPAPEQAFLNYCICMLGLKAGLLCELDPEIAPTNSVEFHIERRGPGRYFYKTGPFKLKRLISMKKSAVREPIEANQSLFKEVD